MPTTIKTAKASKLRRVRLKRRKPHLTPSVCSNPRALCTWGCAESPNLTSDRRNGDHHRNLQSSCDSNAMNHETLGLLGLSLEATLTQGQKLHTTQLTQ